ncbi:cyclic pyranopterin monophosphate synthase MoaC [Sphingomonas sp.]|uniref:cyclic pyranopterin monophosphate synthase MoaC n=1 Tax=Sphingomonas sp. TaxID=28214 RepID=UPI002ED9B850
MSNPDSPSPSPPREREGNLTHLDQTGAAHMVDVAGKPVTAREAIATGRITMSPHAAAAIAAGSVRKGDVLATARIAGIMAAKKTAELIPLCHPLPLTSVSINLVSDETGVTVTATVATEAQTGVEMEALTATTVALLTLYDMAKALDKAMVIGDIRLLSKKGGKSGNWEAS